MVETKDKIYAITQCGHEWDDIYTSWDMRPTKFYTTREKRDKAFKELVEKQLKWFEECKNGKYANPDEYEIGEDTNDDFLELYMGKWVYDYGKAEYEIEE